MERKIYRTKDYGIFKILKGNRDYKKHGEKLLESIRKYGILEPIIVNEKYEIIDGQGRYYAAMLLGIEIPYIFINGLSVKECIELNRIQTNWNLNDYIKSFAEQGNEHYKKLAETIERFSTIDFYSIVFALTGSRARANKIVMDGTFCVTDKGLKYGSDALSYLDGIWSNVKRQVQARGMRKEIFCQVIISIYGMPTIDRAHLQESIQKYITNEEVFPTFTSIDSGLKSFETMYNYRLGVKNKRFFCEYYRKIRQKKIPWWGEEA